MEDEVIVKIETTGNPSNSQEGNGNRNPNRNRNNHHNRNHNNHNRNHDNRKNENGNQNRENGGNSQNQNQNNNPGNSLNQNQNNNLGKENQNRNQFKNKKKHNNNNNQNRKPAQSDEETVVVVTTTTGEPNLENQANKNDFQRNNNKKKKNKNHNNQNGNNQNSSNGNQNQQQNQKNNNNQNNVNNNNQNNNKKNKNKHHDNKKDRNGRDEVIRIEIGDTRDLKKSEVNDQSYLDYLKYEEEHKTVREFNIPENISTVETDFGIFEMILDEQKCFNLVDFNKKYVEILGRYEFIVCDYYQEHLRFKGFNKETVNLIPDYVNEYCALDSNYYVLRNPNFNTELVIEEE